MFNKNPDLFADITDKQTIFIDLDAGIFYVLPLFANLVFRMLISGKHINEIKKTFATFSNMIQDYEQRIDAIFNKLQEFKLIIPCNSINTNLSTIINEETIQDLQDCDFEYNITPSTDLQQLLLDDPIHDVSLDGWTPIKK